MVGLRRCIDVRVPESALARSIAPGPFVAHFFKTSMNPRLTIFRALALLGFLPGLGVIALGLSIGTSQGGLFWLATAAFVVFGGLLIWKSVQYFWRPSRPAAADLLTVLSLVVFGLILSSLRKNFPDAWGIPDRLGIGRENAEGVRMLLALLIAWVLHRALKKWLLEPAFAAAVPEKVIP